jgi:hypothetical protein
MRNLSKLHASALVPLLLMARLCTEAFLITAVVVLGGRGLWRMLSRLALNWWFRLTVTSLMVIISWSGWLLAHYVLGAGYPRHPNEFVYSIAFLNVEYAVVLGLLAFGVMIMGLALPYYRAEAQTSNTAIARQKSCFMGANVVVLGLLLALIGCKGFGSIILTDIHVAQYLEAKRTAHITEASSLDVDDRRTSLWLAMRLSATGTGKPCVPIEERDVFGPLPGGNIMIWHSTTTIKTEYSEEWTWHLDNITFERCGQNT